MKICCADMPGIDKHSAYMKGKRNLALSMFLIRRRDLF
jgi:hypothetical protein